jgi:hypothetical protein
MSPTVVRARRAARVGGPTKTLGPDRAGTSRQKTWQESPRSAPRRERVVPTQVGEAREVYIERVPLAAVIERRRGVIRIGKDLACGTSLLSERRKDFTQRRRWFEHAKIRRECALHATGREGVPNATETPTSHPAERTSG